MLNNESGANDDQRLVSDSNEVLNNEEHENENRDCSTNYDKNIGSVQNGKVPKPDDERKLFVGQLSSDITKEDLEKYFSKFGSIEDVTIKYDGPGGRARGFAFILFDQKESIGNVLSVPTHFINNCQVDPKQAHRRPPVTNPVKKIFIGQLPNNFVEEDLSNYFSQFGIIDTIELPMDRGKSVRRSFGFVSFSSEKTAEEVLRQQRHSINGTSIEVRPAKPRPHEQQQSQQYQQQSHLLHGQYQQQQHNQAYTVQTPYPYGQTMINIPNEASSYYSSTMANNYNGQIIDQYGQAPNNLFSYWTSQSNDPRSLNHTNSNQQWSAGNNSGLASVNNSNSNLFTSLVNPPTSSAYQQNGQPTIFNPNGLAHQISYTPSSYSSAHQSAYTISSSSQPMANLYPTVYSTSSLVPTGDLLASSASPSPSWNQYSNVPHVINGSTNSYEHPNIQLNYSPYLNMYASQFYSTAQPQQGINLSHSGLPVDQTVSSNGSTGPSISSTLDNNYQHHFR